MRWRPENRVGRYLDALLKRRRPARFKATDEEWEAIAAASELASSRPGADLPDPAFVERLARRLRAELEPRPARPSLLNRRALLQTAGASAAAAVAGAVLDHVVVGGMVAQQAATLIPSQGSWRPVAALSQVPAGQVLPVSTGSMQVLVVNDGGRIRALSGVCTHLGCTLQPSAAPGRIDCPCHRTAFSLSGKVLDYQLPRSPGDLPEVESRVRDGQIEIFAV